LAPSYHLSEGESNGGAVPDNDVLGSIFGLLTQFFFLFVKLTSEDFDNVLAFLAGAKMLPFLFVESESVLLGEVK